MRYRAEIPKGQQILMSQFGINPVAPEDSVLLPGSRVRIWYRNCFCYGNVSEIGCANPEYVLRGPQSKGAGVIVWKPESNGRWDCENFLRRGGHLPVSIKLVKSMWAVIELDAVTTKGNKLKKKLYTYDILRMFRNGRFKTIQ